MAEKSQFPDPSLPAASGYSRSNEESATAVATQSKELKKKKKRIKCISYVIAFIVFLTAIILVLILIFLRIRNPKFRVRMASVFDFGIEKATPSFSLTMNTNFTVKNDNFGHFEYKASTVTFTYRGTPVGQVSVVGAGVSALSTNEFDVVVTLSSIGKWVNNGELERDLSLGVVPLSSYAKLDGEIDLNVIKKKKSAEMNCFMEIVTSTASIKNIMCK